MVTLSIVRLWLGKTSATMHMHTAMKHIVGNSVFYAVLAEVISSESIVEVRHPVWRLG
jgi:hypothetical protein